MDPLSSVRSLLKPRSYRAGGFDLGGDFAINFPKLESVKCFSVVSGQCGSPLKVFPNRRAIALTAAILFVLSWIFPVVAGLIRNPTRLPLWWGTVHVVLAFVVAVGAFAIQGLGHGNVDKGVERTTYRIYRSSLHALLVVGVLGTLAGDRIKWANCATGFLWPKWLFL